MHWAASQPSLALRACRRGLSRVRSRRSASRQPQADGARTVVHYAFADQIHDAETGLHYNHHRDHDPVLGRYLQTDPIGLAGGINPYAYVLGNPVAEAAAGWTAMIGSGFRPDQRGMGGRIGMFKRGYDNVHPGGMLRPGRGK